MPRFLHTSDWQLGMTRRFLSEGSQERFNQARFDAIRTLGSVAKRERCEFIIVSGDVFESNHVDRKTVARALEALKDVPVPVYLLPGNHDPLDAASVYRSSTFVERKPRNVLVIETNTPLRITPGLEIVGALWTSKRPAANPIEDALQSLPATGGVIRVCAAHGPFDLLSPDPESVGVIKSVMVEEAVKNGKIHYVALGDRHSVTGADNDGRVWYSGTPERADFGEIESGYALIVDLSADAVNTKKVSIATWRFIEERFDLNTQEDIANLRHWLGIVEGKERTVARLTLVGSISLLLQAELEKNLSVSRDLFGALEVRAEGLAVTASERDFDELGFSGFAEETVRRLRGIMDKGGSEATAACDALLLILRLVKETV